MLTNADEVHAVLEVAAADQEEPPEVKATANAKLLLQERPLDARAATRQDTGRLPNRMLLLTNVSATG